MKSDLFFDETSKIAYNQLTKNSSVLSRVMLNIEQFEIGSRYVTAKVQNRYGDKVTVNIQGGRPGIELQESFFKIKEGEKRETRPSYAYLITRLIQDSSILARKRTITVHQLASQDMVKSQIAVVDFAFARLHPLEE